jgi:hypothetical protein
MLRKLLIALVIVLAAFFWVMAVTVPMVSAMPPLVIALALTILAWYLWKERGKDHNASV